MSGAPYGYRYVRKSQHMDAFYEIDEGEAEIVREIFDRYTEVASRSRPPPERVGDWRSTRTCNTVGPLDGAGMLRNPAYHGQAAFGKTQTTGQRAKPTRLVRARGERHGRRETRRDVAPEQWTSIPVPALITDETFELAPGAPAGEQALSGSWRASRNTSSNASSSGSTARNRWWPGR